MLAGRVGVLPPPPVPEPLAWLAVSAAALLYGLLCWALRRSRPAVCGDGLMLLLGVVLDLTALAEFRTSYGARTAGILAAPWLLLWLGWQLIVVAALVRHRRSLSPVPTHPQHRADVPVPVVPLGEQQYGEQDRPETRRSGPGQ